MATVAPERRRHHRRSTHRAWVEIDGHPCWVVDLSLGGLRFEAPHELRHLGAEIAGHLVYQDDKTMIRMPLRAQVRRVDPELDTVGVAFHPLSDEQVDQLLSVLGAVERGYQQARDLERQDERRRLLAARIARWLAVLTLLGLIGLIGFLVAVHGGR